MILISQVYRTSVRTRIVHVDLNISKQRNYNIHQRFVEKKFQQSTRCTCNVPKKAEMLEKFTLEKWAIGSSEACRRSVYHHRRQLRD